VPPQTAGTFAGNTPGLYGGTRDAKACDPAQMVAFLQQNKDKAKAWADVLGIEPEAIPDYVATLTPAILRSDTYVTNHGFDHGKVTTIPAVLQAGTAILVDNRGMPVTKCYCGNPLTPPANRPRRSYVGETWSTFSPTQVTTIQSTTTAIVMFTLVNPKTNEVFDRPSGTTGTSDQNSETQSRLPAPTLVSPSSGSVINHYPRTTTLTWQPVAGATQYYVEVEFDAGFGTGTARWTPRWNNTTSGTTYTVANFVGSQPGRWRVTGITADGTRGASNEWWQFRYTI
jgi:hypothetical protein